MNDLDKNYKAAGVLIYVRTNDSVKYLVAKYQYDQWNIIGGRKNESENIVETAFRQFCEETGNKRKKDNMLDSETINKLQNVLEISPVLYISFGKYFLFLVNGEDIGISFNSNLYKKIPSYKRNSFLKYEDAIQLSWRKDVIFNIKITPLKRHGFLIKLIKDAVFNNIILNILDLSHFIEGLETEKPIKSKIISLIKKDENNVTNQKDEKSLKPKIISLIKKYENNVTNQKDELGSGSNKQISPKVKIDDEGINNGELFNKMKTGKMIYKNNDIYKGDWKDDKRHGFGKLIYDNGNKIYEGEWENDRKME